MIRELHLENFLFIKNAHIDFAPGLNVITGETGAGKSILLEAVRLILGKKVRSESLFPGAEFTKIQALFTLESDEIRNYLAEGGFLDEDDPEFLSIARIFRKDASGKNLINGMLANSSLLKLLGVYLMEIHGQNEHQTLLQPETQLRLLDRACGESHLKTICEYRDVYKTLLNLQKKQAEIQSSAKNSEIRMEEIRAALDYLKKLNLSDPAEEDNLKAESDRIAHSEVIVNAIDKARKAIDGDDDTPGAIPLLHQGCTSIRRAMAHDVRMNPFLEAFEDIYHRLVAQYKDFCSDFDQIEFDPDRLALIQGRLAMFSRACRKYGADFKGLFDLIAGLENELNELSCPDSALEKLDVEIEIARRNCDRLLERISERRIAVCKTLAEKINVQLGYLGFNGGVFNPAIVAVPAGIGGGEIVEFMVSLNPGAPPGPLRKIASGGELSRVALALKKVLAAQDCLPTLLFDEIDAGIGGTTAQSVADCLKELAGRKQVILVTHLHQIAKEADRHFKVAKIVRGNKTEITIEEVCGKERKAEIARMLGDTGKSGLSFAESLLKDVKKSR